MPTTIYKTHTNHIAWSAFLILLVAVGPSFGQASFSGSISVHQGELPLAHVQLLNSPYGAVTDPGGAFHIESVPVGSYQVVVSSLGYKTIRDSLVIKKGQALTRSYRLEESSLLISDVTVSGKSMASEVNDLAFNVKALDIAAIQNSSANLTQVLNRTSGVRVREDGGLGSDFDFSLNGFTGNQVRFFLDGIPMDNFGSSLSMNNLPLNIVDRVEIYKGVVPVWLGTDALGGAVNIVTSQKQNYLDASYTLGSFNTHRASVNTAYTHKNGFTARTNVFYNYSDNNYRVYVPILDLETRRVGEEQWVERFHDTYRSATVKTEVGVTNKRFADLLLFGFIASGNDKELQNGATMNEVFGQMRNQTRSFIPTIRYKKSDLLTKGLDLSVYGAYNINEFKVIDTSGVRYNWLGEHIRDSRDGAESSRTRITNNDRESLVNANLSYEASPRHSVVLNYRFSGFGRSSFDPEQPEAITNSTRQQLDKNILGLAYRWDPSEKVSATIFGKLYHMTAETFREVGFATEDQGYETFTSGFSKPGYGAAASYRLLKSLKLKASYEHTYRLPEGFEMFGNGLFVVRNPELQPEESDNFNAGAVWNIAIDKSHRISVEPGYIHRSAKNFIRKSLDEPVYRFTNVGKVSTHGLEAQVSYAWKDMLHAGINATYQNILDKQETIEIESFVGPSQIRNYTYNDRLPNLPYLFGNAHLGAKFQNVGADGANMQVNYFFNYVHEYYLAWPSLGSTDTKAVIPQQVSHDVEVSYSLQNGKYNIALECRNITDNRLYDNYYLQKPGRAFYIKLRYLLNNY